MESALAEKIKTFLDTNNFLVEWQHGFRNGRSCTTSLITFYNNVAHNVDNKRNYDVIFLDFAKAFDKIPHTNLIAKLRRTNLHHSIINWILNWISGRKQRVIVNDGISEWLPVTSGVVQGSVVGPLLFLIFINDLKDDITCDISSFADDTKLGCEMRTLDDFNRLQNSLEKVNDWCDFWGMQMNLSKCVVMHFGDKNPKFTYKLNGEALQVVETHLDLGVLVDNKLKFSNHCTHARNKAIKITSFIKHSFN